MTNITEVQENPNFFDCKEQGKCTLDFRCANYMDCKRNIERATFVTPDSNIDVDNMKDTVYLSIPKSDIPRLVIEYCVELETGSTDKWCKCTWALHPDDEKVDEDCCRICGVYKLKHVPEEGSFDHEYRGRRKRLFYHNQFCPVHTKEGRIMSFFDWVFGNAK